MKTSFLIFLLFLLSSIGAADELFTLSGDMTLQKSMLPEAHEGDRLTSLMGHVEMDIVPDPVWFHTRVEGGWNGSVESASREEACLINYDEVYQRNSPFVEFKEAYGAYATDSVELRAGIQRFSWGRLDEYPVNDFLNPWDYSEFLLKSLEDRKIGVPSVAMRLRKKDSGLQLVWVPVFVPCRLPLIFERWSGFSEAIGFKKTSAMEIIQREPELPNRGSVGVRWEHSGPVDLAATLFHGYDPRPVFKTTALSIGISSGKILINPGLTPDFHTMTAVGMDAAFILGNWGVRAEAAYSPERWFNTRWETWGYPSVPEIGTHLLSSNQYASDTLEYGIGVDYRLFEDCDLILQAQQTVLFDRIDILYDAEIETLAFAVLKTGWMNRKIEMDIHVAYNPEHAGVMEKVEIRYVFTDYWTAKIAETAFSGEAQSLFGRYSENDQIDFQIVFSW